MNLEGKSLRCISDQFNFVTLGKLYPIFISKGGSYVYRDDGIGNRSGIHYVDFNKGIFCNMFELVD